MHSRLLGATIVGTRHEARQPRAERARQRGSTRVSPGDRRPAETSPNPFAEKPDGVLLRECEPLSVDLAKREVGELRSLLRFLFVRGLIPLALGDAVPPVASWRDTGIPRAVAPADVERLIASCDRSTLEGARDAAIVLLLARLGLRSIEVARLELSDLDWRAGVLLVRGKGGREDRLPLPDEVGTALAEYLTVRGRREFRHVFLTLRAPTRPIRADLVGDVVRRACEHAGIARITPHRLRHTLASEMLVQGASLRDIGQVLRHRHLSTTAIYAKVDLERLRQVALPWPGAER